jgi:phosphoglycolate phosphatase
VHGLDSGAAALRLEVAGRTDGEIARAILTGAGIAAQRIDDRAEAVRETACRIFASTCEADLSEFVVAGIPGLLAALGEQPGAQLSLLTGNFEPIARLKLARAGLGHRFPPGQGAFGSDSEDRSALPRIARRRAGHGTGRPYPREQAIVIGDTPRDIACARADGLRCVAVTSGQYGAEALADADAVAEGTEQLREHLVAFGVLDR